MGDWLTKLAGLEDDGTGPDWLDKLRPHSAGEYAQQAAGSAVRGFTGAAGLAMRAEAGIRESIPVVGGLLGAVPRAVASGLEAVGKMAPAPVPGLEESFLAAKVPEGMASSLAFAPAALGGPLAVAAAGTLIQGRSGYEEAQAAGASPTDTLLATAGNALLGPTEAVGFGKVLTRAAKGSAAPWLRELIGESAEEFVQETGQNIGSDVVARQTYDPGREVDVAGALEQGAAAALGAGIASGGVSGLNSMRGARTAPPGAPQPTDSGPPPGYPGTPPPITQDLTGKAPIQEQGAGAALPVPSGGETTAPGTPVAPTGGQAPAPLSPEAKFLLEHNRVQGEEVQPTSPEGVYAQEFAAQHGMRTVFVRSEKPLDFPAVFLEGTVVLDERSGVRPLIYHEALHALVRENRSEAEALIPAIQKADPEGFQKHLADYALDFQALHPLNQALPESLATEEGAARYVERLEGYLYEAFQNPEKLRSLLEAEPTLIQRVLDTIIRVLQKAGVTFQTSQQKTLRELRKFARTPFEKGIKPNQAAALALQIQQSLDTLLPRPDQGGQTATLTQAPLAPAPTVPVEVPPILTEADLEADFRAEYERKRTDLRKSRAAELREERKKKRAEAQAQPVPAVMPKGKQIGTDLTGAPVYSKEERGDLERPDAGLAKPKSTQVGMFDEQGGLFEQEAAARDQGKKQREPGEDDDKVEIPEDLPEGLEHPEIQAELRRMADNAGWETFGGEMIRTEDGKVLGREHWNPKERWWAERPEDARLSVEATRKAVEKALSGKKLGAKEQRAVDYMLDVAERAFRQMPEGSGPSVLDILISQQAEIRDEEAPFAVAQRRKARLADKPVDAAERARVKRLMARVDTLRKAGKHAQADKLDAQLERILEAHDAAAEDLDEGGEELLEGDDHHTEIDTRDIQSQFQRAWQDRIAGRLANDEDLVANLRDAAREANLDDRPFSDQQLLEAAKDAYESSARSDRAGRGGKFAVAPRGEDERNLAVVHNLSAENLRFTDELGGEIALPSVAISKVDDPIQGFGEISLVARPGLVDPKGKQGARVYNADVYSPRYPSATYTLRPAARERWKPVQEWFAKAYPDPKGESYDLRSVAYGLEAHLDASSRFQRDGIPGLYSDQALQAYYADTVLGERVTGTDSGEGRARLAKLIAEHEDEFQAFVRRLFDGTVERKLFKGFTPSGNRKHAPYTIENVLREMRKELRSGEPFFYGAGSVRAKVAKRYRSLEAVQKDRGKLVSEKEMAALKDRFNQRLHEIAGGATAAYDGKPDFGYTERFWNAVLDSMKSRSALKEYGFDAAQMPWAEIRSFLDELRDAPSEYFEAKIDRAVHLSEFAGALVPDDAAADVRPLLEKRGLEIETYKRNDQASRAQALQRLTVRLEEQGPPVRFAVSSRKDSLGFFSQLEDVLQAKLPKKASPKQVLDIAKGAKQEELAWSGLEDWLKGKESVSKEDVLAFLAENNVEVQEVVLGDPGVIDWAETQHRGETHWIGGTSNANGAVHISRLPGNGLFEMRSPGGMHETHKTLEQAKAAGEQVLRNIQRPNTKFNNPSYSLPGVEPGTYREVLLTLPERRPFVEPEPLTELPEGYEPITDSSEPPHRRWAVTPPGQAHARPYAGRHPTREAALDQALEYVNESRIEAARKVWQSQNQQFTDGHFDEPNVLAHVRLNERTDADGRRTLFLEEIQSDWHQKARKARTSKVKGLAREKGIPLAEADKLVPADAGYLTKASQRAVQERIAAARAALNEATKAHEAITRAYIKDERVRDIVSEQHEIGRAFFLQHRDGWFLRDGEPVTEWHSLTGRQQEEVISALRFEGGLEITPPAKRYDELQAELQSTWLDRLNESDQRLARARDDVRAAEAAEYDSRNSGQKPDAPFKSTWHELALKRMVRWAAEQGFDQVAWTTGDQQAERYKKALTDAADTIEVEPWHGGYRLRVSKEGRDVLGGPMGVEPDKLADQIGKAMADEAQERIQAGEESVTFRSKDGTFKVGGHGMRGFYDKMLVSAANKLGKRFGVEVDVADVDAAETALDRGFDIFRPGAAESYSGPWRTREQAQSEAQPGDIVRQRGALPVHVLPITPAMRQAVMEEGLPRFAVSAYHGSPHDFDEFSTEKIGTGEGAQSYGWGLYFTDKKEIAEHYKTRLVAQRRDSWWKGIEFPPSLSQQEVIRLAALGLQMADKGNLPAAEMAEWQDLHDRNRTYEDAVEKARPKGRTYQVELAPEDDEYLLWDEPLSKQSKKVRAALEGLGFDLTPRDAGPDWGDMRFAERTGQSVYLGRSADLGMAYRTQRFAIDGKYPDGPPVGDRLTSRQFHAAGIRGIKYLDGSSRAKGEGTYNYVIFDDNDVKVRAKFAVASQGQSGFDLPEDSLWYRRMVDDTHRLVQAERAAPVPVAGGETLEQAISTYPGKKFGEDEKLQREIVEPIKRLLRSSKISLDDAGEFLYALAAPQANATLAKKHPRKFGAESRPGSGMTNSAASAIVEKALSGPQAAAYRRLQALNQKLVVKRLDALESGSLISAETRAAWEEAWGPDYVPFRTAEDPGQQLGLGKGFTVAGKESKKREGRKSRADNPLVFTLVTARQALERKERNRVGNLLADLVAKNPATFWRVTDDLNTKKDGEESLSFKENGEQRWILTDDQGLIAGFKRLQVDTEAIAWIDPTLSWLHNVIIKWNLVFPFTNVPRDIGSAFVRLGVSEDAKSAARVAKNALPAARGAWKAIRKEGAGGRWGTVYREARDAGALIGWSQQFDFQEQLEDFRKELDAGRFRRAVGYLAQAVEDMNRATELGTRLAVFDAAKKKGKSAPEAAVLARRATADFARRGSLTPAFRRVWLFFGANVQGTDEMLRAIKDNPHRAAVALGTMIALGYVAALASRTFGDDEDETETGRATWDDLSSYDKGRKAGVVVGDTMYGMPSPYGWGFFWYLGTAIADAVHGPKRKPQELTREVLGHALGAVSPLQGADAAMALVPSLARPFYEVKVNENFAGSPIMPAQNPFARVQPPESQRAFRSVSPAAKSLAEGMNRMTGGDEVDPGWVDVSPEAIEHFVKAATGGLGTNVGRLERAIEKTLAGDPVRLTDWPVARAFASQVSEGVAGQLFYERITEIERAEKRQKAGLALDQEEQAALSLRPQARAAERQTSALRKKIRESTDEAQTKSLEAELRAVHQSFNRAWAVSTKK